MKQLKARAVLLVFLALIWILLTAPFSREEAIAGAIVAILILILPLPGGEVFGDLRLTPRALVTGIVYLFVFLGALIRSNLDVAFRVLHPRLPINPGIVRVRTRLKTRLGRILLANSITLTPGTITVETRDEDFYIHWISVEGEDSEARSKAIVEGFEKYLEVICG